MNESTIKKPKSEVIGIFFIMLDSPLAPIVENDDKFGDVKQRFLKANISNEPDVYGFAELNRGELV